jgi:hypothetical protein
VVDTVKMRRPPIPAALATPSGRVARDERGNAVWKWSADDPRHAGLELAGLSLDDEPPPPAANVTLRRVATVKGYNPYESGLLDKPKSPPRKRDLRALSQWIEQRRQRGDDDSR